ncbi:MAG: exo-alpha-sialidase [Clostridia bacterium]|nr:exo-alpha-sialidase [Clostridia bacterium]
MREIIPSDAEQGVVHRYPLTTLYKYNGWPSVCIDDRGVLYAVASSMRLSHVCPCGKNCMWVSRDLGKTWTPPIIIHDSKFDDRDTGIAYLGDGKMIATWFSESTADFYSGFLSYDWVGAEDREIARGYVKMLKELPPEEIDRGCDSFVMLSDDYGVTWSDPIRVSVTSPHGATVCRDGSLIYLGNNWRPPMGYAAGTIFMIRSRDGGKTWQTEGHIVPPEGLEQWQMHEPHVIELPNGRLLGAIRVHGRSVQPENTVYTTFSDDGGKTWTEPKFIGIDGLPPHLLLHSSGAVILSYGCRTPGKRAERAVVSYDNGETWEDDYLLCDSEKEINQYDLGYPCTAELPDGSLITVFYQCCKGDWYTSVQYTKWKLGKKD